MHAIEHIIMVIGLGLLTVLGVVVWLALSICCTDEISISKVNGRLWKLAVSTFKFLIVLHFLSLLYLFGISKLTVKMLQLVLLYDCKVVLILISISAVLVYPLSILEIHKSRKARLGRS